MLTIPTSVRDPLYVSRPKWWRFESRREINIPLLLVLAYFFFNIVDETDLRKAM